MKLIAKMKALHILHPEFLESTKEKILRKKQEYLENLKLMNLKTQDHQKVFNKVKDLLTQLPDLFEHFKKLAGIFPNESKDETADDGKETNDKSDEDKSMVIQPEKSVEEKALISQKDSEASPLNTETETESEQEEESEGKDTDTDDDSKTVEPKKEDIDNHAGKFDDKLKGFNEHPGIKELDDGMLNRLEDEQQKFEIRQKGQSKHEQDLKALDNGLTDRARTNKNFTSRFMDDLKDQQYRPMSSEVENHLKNMADLFAAKQF